MVVRSEATLSSDDVPGARPGTRDEVVQPAGFSPKKLTPCANQSGLTVKAAKLAARSRLSGPQTPEIVLDRGRSPSTDSVLSLDHQDANFSPGKSSLPQVRNPLGTPHGHPLSCPNPCNA